MTEAIGKKLRSALNQGRLMIIFAFVIGICLVGILSSDGADAADGDKFTIEGIVYQVVSETDRTVKINDYTGSATELALPAKVTNGSVEYSVTSIGHNAFDSCTSLTSVTIPNSVTSISDRAFLQCTSLTSVTIPDSIKSIDMYTFAYCTSLTSVTIPNSVTYLGHSLFENCTSLTSVTMGDSVTNFDYWLFRGCTQLETIVIRDIESISSLYSAYEDCHADLKFVKIGHSLETYSDASFTTVLSMETIRTTNCTIYFKTTVNQYTITFDSAGGNDVTSITQDYGTAVTAPADPTRTGYTFSGWSPAVPETMPAENITCVAQWTAIDYTVTFNPNGGTVDPTTKTVNYGAEYGELPTPTKAGNNFIGWFTASDDSGVKINSDTAVLSAENHTLYAKWNPISDDGGGMNIGLIIGGVVAVIAIAGVGVFLFMRSRP